MVKTSDKDSKFSVRVDSKLRAALERAALEEDRTLTSLIVRVLSQWCKAQGYLK